MKKVLLVAIATTLLFAIIITLIILFYNSGIEQGKTMAIGFIIGIICCAFVYRKEDTLSKMFDLVTFILSVILICSHFEVELINTEKTSLFEFSLLVTTCGLMIYIPFIIVRERITYSNIKEYTKWIFNKEKIGLEKIIIAIKKAIYL